MPAPTLETFEEIKLVLLNPWGSAALVLSLAVVLLAVALAARSYRRHRTSVRLLLVALRVLSAAAVLVVVLQPAMQLRSVTLRPNHVALLLDLSRSMSIREQEGEPTRRTRALALLQASRKRLTRWGARRVISAYGFGEGLRPIPLPVGDAPRPEATEEATRIHAALAALRQRHRSGELGGVVLISDGNDNDRYRSGRLTPRAQRFLERFGAPVHTVLSGQDRIRDLAIVDVHADEFAFVRNAVSIEAEVVVSGISAAELTLTLNGEGRTLATRRVKLERGRSRYRVKLEFVPQEVGKYVYTVSAPVLPGEALEGNNSHSFLIKVIRDRIRVLQICGRPSWDVRFLRSLLKQDPNVDLISFFILRTLTSLAAVPPSQLSLIPFPTEELFERELGSFDLVLLQNFNFGPYGIGGYLPHLRQYVERGGGLAMIGGDLSFTSGGYARTPIAAVLPVELLPAGVDTGRLLVSEDFRLKVTREGRDHPILQIGRTRQDTAGLLASLPMLAGINRVAGPAPKANVLAVHPFVKTERGAPMPVLAVREVGKGRSLALTTDSSWSWAFEALEGVGSREGYDRFWRNAIRWLIRDPELTYLQIIAQQGTVRLGNPIRARVRVYQPDYSPAPGIDVRYRAVEVDGKLLRAGQGKTDADGELALEFAPRRTGAVRIETEATLGGRRSRERELVLVEPAGPELRDPRVVPELLRQIAAASGGRYLGEIDELPELDFVAPRVVQVNWQRDVELWSRWWWLAIAVALFALEWMTRRRYGHF